ncbi:MAG: thiamine pyrophosphate-dependent enzyme [Francisellaceae bacterium]
MATHSIAEEIVYQLAEYGIKQIFGITGDAMNAVTDAIRRDGRITWYTVRHEEVAGFAAAAQAELSQELAVCVGTIGPGALHYVNGLYNAKRDRSPVLVITGQVPGSEIASDYFQEVDQLKIFDDLTVFNQVLQRPQQMPRLIQQAIEAAVSQRGVAHLSIPTDLSIAEIEKSDRPVCIFPRHFHLVIPSAEELEKMAALINSSRRPSLLIGAGARGARVEVMALSETLQAPVAHSLKGTEVLEHDYLNNIGGIGHVGTPHGLAVVENADLLIMLGTDFPYSAFLPTHGNVIQIDLNPEKLGHRCPVACGAIGEVKSTLQKLLPLIDSKTDSTHLKKLQRKKTAWIESTNEKYLNFENTQAVIHPQSVVLKIAELADDNAIFIADVGEITVWTARYLRMHGSQRLIGSFSHGSLGVALPAAIGAKAKYPDRQVISMSGDGAFSMLLGDLVTASRYGLNLTSVVFVNNKFGFVELEMEAAGYPRYVTDLVNPNYKDVAIAHGCDGIRVQHINELEPALIQAFKNIKPTVIEVFVNPDELIIPPKIDLSTAWKFTTGRVKEMFIEKKIKSLF